MTTIKKPTAKLGKAGGKALMQFIEKSLKADKEYFASMKIFRNLLSGDHDAHLSEDQKKHLKIIVNLGHAHVRSLLPTLFFKNPTLDCMPTSPMHAGKELIYNAVLDNTLNKIGFAEEAKKVALDAAFLPEAVMKDLLMRPEEEGSSSEDSSRGPTPWGSKGSPAHVRLRPEQLIIDYKSKDRSLEKARFIVIRYTKTIEELENDGKYTIAKTTKTEKQRNLYDLVGEPGEPQDEFDDSRKESREAGENDVTIYEVWIHRFILPGGKIKLQKQMCVLMEGQDAPIRELVAWDEVMVPGFDRYPVTTVCLNPVPDRKAVSELGVWKDLQLAIDWLMSRLVQLVENDRLLYLYDKSKIVNEKELKRQFYSGGARELVEVNDVAGAVNLLQPSFAGRDNYSLINLVQQYSQQVTGLGQNRRGGSGIRTAREAHIIEAGVQLKTDEKVDSFEKFLIKVVTKTAILIRGIVKSAGNTDWVMRVAGDTGTVDWLNFSAEDLDWMPDILFKVNSFRKQDNQDEMQKLGGLFTLALQLKQVNPNVKPEPIFKRILEAANINDYGKIVGDQDAQSMEQTMEIAAMIAGANPNSYAVSKEDNDPVHVQIITAFRNSRIGQILLGQISTLDDALTTHEQEHIQQLQVKQGEAQKAAATLQNPFATIGGDNQNAFEEAAGVAQDARTAPGAPAGLEVG